jgi:hypothetical protein
MTASRTDPAAGRRIAGGGQDPGAGLLPRPPVPVAADWLALREPADAAARPAQVADRLRSWITDRPQTGGPLQVHDLGAGTGAMMRWLAPRLLGPQRWVLHDVDAGLLRRAVPGSAGGRLRSGDVVPVAVEVRRDDVTQLAAEDLRGAGVITASALLDLLTEPELDRLVAAGTEVGCPLLFSLTVVGRVELTPADPLDRAIGEAFDDHQRRPVGGGRLLGPDAPAFAAAALRAAGHAVATVPSPWRLTPAQARLTLAWLDGWVAPAVQIRPDLAGPAHDYLDRRREQARRGALAASVHHVDLLARPGGRA